MRKRRTGLFAMAGLAALVTVLVDAAPAQAVSNSGLTATIALNNCSAALVRYPTSVDTDRALMLTNGHCYEGGFINAGQVLRDRASNRSGSLLDSAGTTLGTVQADRLLYATMTKTDVALYRLTDTFGGIQSRFGVTALTIDGARPADGIAISIPSSYWKRVWACRINGFVHTLREDQWTWQDAIRYDAACDTTHGTSGSPVVDNGTGMIVGINNTGNDNGGSCTLNNPCEVDPAGNTTVHQGQGYGEQTYWFTTCLDPTNAIDLTVSGCLLTKPAENPNTVTVTDPGAQTSTVGVSTSLRIDARSSGTGQTLIYSATDLPTGLALNTDTGVISGAPTTAQNTTTTVTARDTTGATGSASFSWTVNGARCRCFGQRLANPGFESGAVSWTASPRVIGRHAGKGQAARGGAWSAWLNGRGEAGTDTLSQTVRIPAGCRATLTVWVHIDTDETSRRVGYDRLTMQAGPTTLGSLSNLDAASGYGQRTYDLTPLAGRRVALTFIGTEDESLQTSFVIDDVAVTFG